jgi:hypothetical protein
MNEAHVFLIKPQQIKGMFVTGTPAKREYLQLLPELKEALSCTHYVFASISMVYKKSVVENGLPTLAVAFDERILSPQQYSEYVDNIGTKVLETLKPSGLSLNIVVLDRGNSFLQHFTKHSEWLVNIKERESLVSFRKPWWKFW